MHLQIVFSCKMLKKKSKDMNIKFKSNHSVAWLHTFILIRLTSSTLQDVNNASSGSSAGEEADFFACMGRLTLASVLYYISI